MIRPYCCLLAATALLAALPSAGAAEVYKWVDDDGITHYSQEPPPNGTPMVIKPDPAPPSAVKAGANGDDSDAAAQGADEDGEKETIAGFCKDLREKESLLTSDRPVRVKEKDGTLTPLTGEARAQRLEQVRTELERNCQGENSG